MTQEDWVNLCQSRYRVDPPQGYHFEDAHYPLSRKMGGITTVSLWYPDHIIQGCLQTLEFNYPCIDTRKSKLEREIVQREYPEYLSIYDEACLYSRRYSNICSAKTGARESNRRKATEQRKRGVLIIAPDGSEHEFPSCTAAGKKFNLHLGELSKCCHGKISHVKGYKASFLALP